MIRKSLLLAVIMVLSSFSCLAQEKEPVQKTVKENDTLFVIDHGRKYVVDKTVIKVKPKKDEYRQDETYRNLYTSKSGYHYLEVPTGMDIENLSELLKQSNQCEDIEYVTECKILFEPNDPHKTHQWFINKINLKDAWDITTGNSNIKVAIIDVGVVDNTYADLGYSSYGNYTNISYTLGHDYASDYVFTPEQKVHGTHVACVVGAKTNNGLYGCGITGGNNCSGVTLISYRVKNELHLVQAINQAVDDGAKVINLSLSSPYDLDIEDAIENAYNHNVSIACATGNDSLSSIRYPASNNLTIAVGASNQQDLRCTFSNYGTGLDIVAPGDQIYVQGTSSNSFISVGGTSIAAPMVSGTIALMLSVNPDLTPSEIRTILHNSATKGSYVYTSGWNSEVGYGFLNTYLAVLYARLKIAGPKYISDEESYEIENLPSGYTVEWSLSNSYYNQNCLEQDEPYTNQCTITCSSSQIMMNATLTANIKYNGVTVHTLTKTVCAYDRFRGHYTSGNISADIDYTYILHVAPNYNTIITSPILLGATVSYSSSGTTPLYWGFSPSTGEINLTMPANNNGIPIVLYINDVCGNQYTLYLFRASSYSINVSYEENSITIMLNKNFNYERGLNLEQPYTIEIRNAVTGDLMAIQSTINLTEIISTLGWPKGVYVVKVKVGKEEFKEKIIVN